MTNILDKTTYEEGIGKLSKSIEPESLILRRFKELGKKVPRPFALIPLSISLLVLLGSVHNGVVVNKLMKRGETKQSIEGQIRDHINEPTREYKRLGRAMAYSCGWPGREIVYLGRNINNYLGNELK